MIKIEDANIVVVGTNITEKPILKETFLKDAVHILIPTFENMLDMNEISTALGLGKLDIDAMPQLLSKSIKREIKIRMDIKEVVDCHAKNTDLILYLRDDKTFSTHEKKWLEAMVEEFIDIPVGIIIISDKKADKKTEFNLPILVVSNDDWASFTKFVKQLIRGKTI